MNNAEPKPSPIALVIGVIAGGGLGALAGHLSAEPGLYTEDMKNYGMAGGMAGLIVGLLVGRRLAKRALGN